MGHLLQVCAFLACFDRRSVPLAQVEMLLNKRFLTASLVLGLGMLLVSCSITRVKWRIKPALRSRLLDSSPVRISGPWRSINIETGCESFLLRLLRLRMTCRWDAWSPCDMLSLARFIPAWANPASVMCEAVIPLQP
jgi:hypothetical protein